MLSWFRKSSGRTDNTVSAPVTVLTTMTTTFTFAQVQESKFTLPQYKRKGDSYMRDGVKCPPV
jgi:hypothetical protein